MAGPAQDSYAEEQARLRAEHEGEKNIHIDVPQEPEVDPKVYRDVETLLFRGFLYVPAEINGVKFVFKSLNQHEYDHIRLLTDNQDQTFYNTFLAFGIMMINGVSVLRERERWLPDLSELFGSMPNRARNKVIRVLSELNRRAAGAVTMTEAYSMEKYSRFRWVQVAGLGLSSTDVTGFVGTDALGLNWAQLVWRALNTYEDQKEQAERDWDNAKFIGSCFAGKGMSKVYAQDHERRRKETEARVSRKDALIRHVLLGKPLNESDQRPGEVMVIAKTVDQLADQLERSLKGEQDWHDEVVASVERRAREREQAKQARLHEIVAERETQWGDDKRVIGETSLSGLTPAEVQEKVAKRREQITANMSRQRDPRIEDSLEKWLGAEEPPMAPVRPPKR